MTATIERLRTTLALQMALDSKRRAARITDLREQARLTQRALEEKSGVSERTIQRAEDPDDDIELRYSTREKLAKAFGVKPDDLLPEADAATKGETPDPFSKNGDMADADLRQQVQDLHAKVDRIIDALGLDKDAEQHPLDQISEIASKLPGLLAADDETAAATETRPAGS
jgi:transcriptional regulator with XRE-family HTH domain